MQANCSSGRIAVEIIQLKKTYLSKVDIISELLKGAGLNGISNYAN